MERNSVKAGVFVVIDLENSFPFFLRGVLFQLFCPIVNLNYLTALAVMLDYEVRFKGKTQSLGKSCHEAQAAGETSRTLCLLETIISHYLNIILLQDKIEGEKTCKY